MGMAAIRKASNLASSAKGTASVGRMQQELRDRAIACLASWKLRLLANEMNQILPGLYLGSMMDALNEKVLKEKGVSAVVSVTDLVVFSGDENEEVESLWARLSDTIDADVISHFAKVNSFIHSRRLQNSGLYSS